MKLETAFTMDTSRVKYGPGVTREVGYDMANFGAKRVMVVTDERVAKLEPVAITMAALRAEGIDAVLYDQVRVEPSDKSFQHAVAFATAGNFDGYVAVGGGSSIDTAKAANLYATYPADFLTYVNKPIGQGQEPPGPLMPMIAIPTTAGTGSETTGLAIFDLSDMHVKTGIALRALRPQLGIIDPHNTRTMPKAAAAGTGLDVLCHAIESYTAIPYDQRPAPANPRQRPAYQGANPISDIWTAKAIQMTSQFIVRAVNDPEDDEAREQMMLAATYAGIGFGNAGCHLPHAMSYPVSSGVRGYSPPDYPDDHPMVPHGMSVILNAPAVFRFTASTSFERHLQAAKMMGLDTRGASAEDAGDILAEGIIDLMKKVYVPNGLSAVGFTLDDLDTLVAGTLPQKRLTKMAPREATVDELRQLFADSMTLW